MASRVRIAAAACVVASGLFVGSASATMAFADSQSGPGDEIGGPQASGAVDVGSTSSPGTAPEDTASAMPTTEAVVPVGVPAVVPKPPSIVGDGRNGLESKEPEKASAELATSKQSEARRRGSSQTMPTRAGEPDVPEVADVGVEFPAGLAPEDPTKPEEPMKHQPGYGWPWWGGPCPDPHDPDDPDDPDDPGGPGLPPGNSGGGGGGGAQPKPPSGRPDLPPAMQLPLPREVPPQLPNISVDPVVDAVTGLATAAAELPFVPITLPVVVAPLGVGGAGGGAGGTGAGPRAGTPSAPKAPGPPQNSEPAPKAGQQNPPAFSASNGVPPASFRAGYGNYLRTAGVGEMMAVAIPGVAGILVLTGAGGLLGYRQARAGRAVRASGTARFMG